MMNETINGYARDSIYKLLDERCGEAATQTADTLAEISGDLEKSSKNRDLENALNQIQGKAPHRDYLDIAELRKDEEQWRAYSHLSYTWEYVLIVQSFISVPHIAMVFMRPDRNEKGGDQANPRFVGACFLDLWAGRADVWKVSIEKSACAAGLRPECLNYEQSVPPYTFFEDQSTFGRIPSITSTTFGRGAYLRSRPTNPPVLPGFLFH